MAVKKKPHKKLNPIAKKINRITETTTLTKEIICVKINVVYPTFNNIFSRNTVSKATLLALEMAGIINRKDVYEYKLWCEKQKNTNAKPKTPIKPNKDGDK